MSMSPGGPPTNYSSMPYGTSSPGSLAGRTQFNQSLMGSGSPAPSSATGDHFSAQMRDRQARGKDPYHSGDGSDGGNLDDGEPGKLRLGHGRVEKEDFSRVERRQKAIAFLDNPELLMVHAQSTGESIPATRLHFMKLLCGYDDDESEHTTAYSSHSHSRRDHPHSPDKRRGGFDPRSSTN